jgi:glycosyltransferase involved in cell wall biosynthesis
LTVPVPVAVDGRRLQDRPLGGVGRWLATLLPDLVSRADIVLLTDASRPPAAFRVPGGGLVAEAPLWLPARAPEVVWIQVSVPRWLRGFRGLFHGTFNQLPATWHGPAIVSFHDLAPRDHPEDFDGAPVKRRVWTAQFRQAARQAAAVHTDSEYIRQAVLAAYRLHPYQVVVAAPSLDPVFGPDRGDRGRQRAAALGATRDYVVAVGGASRRGLPVAIAAWNLARGHGVTADLLVVGQASLPPQPGLVVVGPLPDEDWADVLAGARALCYPTRYEGFGYPALEAAASGVPVVCAPVAALPEVLGDAAEWCPEPAAPSIAAGLERVLGDPARHAQLRAAGLARAAAAPTAAASAEVLLSLYEQVAG